jgi:RimJ/RimL family protein N-acetyltransferase
MLYPLVSERLCIEPIELKDLETFVKYRRVPEIARFQSWTSSYSFGQARELLESQTGVSIPKKGEWLQLAVRDASSGELVGDLALHALGDENLCFELGFTISTPHQGKGFAKEAVSTLIQNLKTQVDAKKFVANVDSRNTPSIRVLLRLGFRCDPSKSWTEEFKNELVTVNHFESD